MVYEKTFSSEANKQNKLNTLGQELEGSLKFHHSHTLQKIPQEVAVQAMIEVWQSCHSKQTYEFFGEDSTIIVPSREMAKVLECRNLL